MDLRGCAMSETSSPKIVSPKTASPKTASPETTGTAAVRQPPSVFQCLNGAGLASLLSWGAYSLTHKVAQNFAAHPFRSSNYVAVNISIATRTLVVGSLVLATAVFSIAALGLLGLGIQTLLQKWGLLQKRDNQASAD